jgi:hypothetical protein
MNVIVACLLLTASAAGPPDGLVEVKGLIATRVQFGGDAREKVASAGLDLLRSCTHSATASEEDWLKALHKCHLDIKFTTPRNLIVNRSEKITVAEMLITFPLASGGIWVRSGERYTHFAKFDPQLCIKIQELLGEAKPAAIGSR